MYSNMYENCIVYKNRDMNPFFIFCYLNKFYDLLIGFLNILLSQSLYVNHYSKYSPLSLFKRKHLYGPFNVKCNVQECI